jgi:putative chitinase
MPFLFDRSIFWAQFPQKFGPILPARQDALNSILARIEQDSSNWENLNQIAYALATFKWETMHTFQPVEERGSLSYFDKYELPSPLSIRLGNTQPGDGFLFRGRGYVQITGRANYTHIGNLLGIDLVGNPEQTQQPDIAYQIAAGGMSHGWFTGHRLSQHIPSDGPPDYLFARMIINDHDHAQDIAGYAQNFQSILTAAAGPGASAGQSA